MTGYRAAWESNDPEAIGALFTDDALYYAEPYSEPFRGRDEIVAKWLERKDEPGSTNFTWTTLAHHDGLAFVQGETDYGSIKYSNLWVIRLAPSGGSDVPAASDFTAATEFPAATEFTEWWMDQSKPS